VIVMITMIAAIGENSVIGAEGQIPWRLPTDFAHFKRTTMGKPLVMGRKTFASIGRPLPGRTNIVVTRQRDFSADGVIGCHSLTEAIDQAREIVAGTDDCEIIIGGGGEIYREAMPLADRLIITHVAVSPPGDARFPPIDPDIWNMVLRHDIGKGENDSADFTIVTYERRGGSAR
jgi:dihydrofolate reductase